ncbi:hypothetical protein F5B19DRAFT_464433 [Rostrohypoxylon terebratum]|nr:hypothetical protein F5B19DRAFT_464433 [Rostrohypoxylon terebratum]
MANFQIMSGLYLGDGRVYGNYSACHIVPKAPYLVLLGNVSSFKETQKEPFLKFLECQLVSFRIVFFVLGMDDSFLTSVPEVKEIFNEFSLNMA